MSRFPRWVYEHGSEPDPRFSLANERTFLAWSRTALALIAAGVALEALALPVEPTLRAVAAVILLGLGAALPLLSWWDWGRAERAMRLGEPLPSSYVRFPLAVGTALVSVVVLLGLLLR